MLIVLVCVLCGRYRKAVYRQYTDATFTTRVKQPEYTGLLGPTLIAEVGDSLKIVLKVRHKAGCLE